MGAGRGKWESRPWGPWLLRKLVQLLLLSLVMGYLYETTYSLFIYNRRVSPLAGSLRSRVSPPLPQGPPPPPPLSLIPPPFVASPNPRRPAEP